MLPFMVCSMFAHVFFECPQILQLHHAQNVPMRAGWAFLAGMTLGALPCILVVPIYIIVWQSKSVHPAVLPMLVLLWVLLQVLLKWSGVHVWRTASPAAPHLGHVFWILYVELVLGLLGVGIFMSTVGSAIAYSLSTGVVLAMHTLRGVYLSWRSAPDMDTHIHPRMLRRVLILLEMWISLVSKLSVFVLYVMHSSMKLAFGNVQADGEETVRTRVSGQNIVVPDPSPLATFKRQNTSGSFGIVIGIVCCAISVVVSLIAWRLLPKVWKRKNTAQRNRIFPEVVGAESCRTRRISAAFDDDAETSAGSAGSKALSDSQYQEAAQSNDPYCFRQGRNETPQPPDMSSGWLPGGSDSVVAVTQVRLLRTFFNGHVYQFVSFYFFTVALLMQMVGVSEVMLPQCLA